MIEYCMREYFEYVNTLMREYCMSMCRSHVVLTGPIS